MTRTGPQPGVPRRFGRCFGAPADAGKTPAAPTNFIRNIIDAELAAGHDGVYGWDIDGGDWQFWEEGVSDARLVADTYAQLARSAGAGVVLMHDSTARADEPSAIMRRNNRTLEAITRLVPVLQREGFVFSALPAG